MNRRGCARANLSKSHMIWFKGFGNAQRLSRQGAANGANEIDDIGPLDIGTIAQAGERCVEKVKLWACTIARFVILGKIDMLRIKD